MDETILLSTFTIITWL